MENFDKSMVGKPTSSAGCSGSGSLLDSPGSCLSSGYCSDDAGSGHDDVFFGRHGKDCWMSSTDIDTVDLLRGSLPPFDAELCSTASSAAISHDSMVDATVKFDDIVDNWLFNSMSVPSPCVDHDWPLPPPSVSTLAAEGLDDLPTDSVLADLLLNQSAYTAASAHLTRPQVEIVKSTPSTVSGLSGKPEVATAAGACQTETTSSLSVICTTKRTLDMDSSESSAARRRRSSLCRGCCHVPEVTSSSASCSTTKLHPAAVCCDCSTESELRRSESFCTPTSTEVDLNRLSALRPEWPGFADVVVSEPVRSQQLSLDDSNKTESVTQNSDVEARASETVAFSTESGRTESLRPVILEALLRASSKLDASGSSDALCDQLAVSDDASPSNQEPRLLHRLLRGELDEADIHRAAEQAAAAAAAANDQQQQPERKDAAENGEGWAQPTGDDVRLFAELANYCDAITSNEQASTASEPDVDSIVATIQVPVGSDGDDWLRRYLGDVFSCSNR